MASEAGFNVSGFDASENLIKIARERMPGADFKTGDME
jgi:trans-aconitate methyltransferase